MGVANEHPRNGRVTTDGVNLLIISQSVDDTVPVSDCSNTESGGWFVAGDVGGHRQITGEFEGIKLTGEATPIEPGKTYAASLLPSNKEAGGAYTGTFYVENVRRQGQVTQNGPATWSARGTFSEEVTIPTA